MIDDSLKLSVFQGFLDSLTAAIETGNVEEARSVVWAGTHAHDEGQIDDGHLDVLLRDFYAFNDCL